VRDALLFFRYSTTISARYRLVADPFPNFLYEVDWSGAISTKLDQSDRVSPQKVTAVAFVPVHTVFVATLTLALLGYGNYFPAPHMLAIKLGKQSYTAFTL